MAASETDLVIREFTKSDPKVRDDAEFRKALVAATSASGAATTAYLRISEFDAETDVGAGSIGVVRQLKDIATKLVAEGGLRLAVICVDQDVSAVSSTRRPAYEAAMASLATAECSVLYVYSQDRLVRTTKDLAELATLINELSPCPRIASVVEAKDLDLISKEGVLSSTLLTAVAQHEAMTMSSRQAASQRDRASKGLWTSGTLPYGYAKRKGKDHRGELRQVKSEVDLIHMGRDMLLGGASIYEVTKAFNASRKKPRRAKKWVKQAVRQIYLSPAQYGIRTYTPRMFADARRRPAPGAVTLEFPGKWPPNLDPALRETLAECVSDPAKQGRRWGQPVGKNPRRWWVNTNARCGVCGAGMGGVPRADGKHRYQCRDGAHVTILADLLEEFCAALVVAALEAQFALPEMPKADVAELERIQKDRAELAVALQRGEVSGKNAATAMDALDERERALLAFYSPPQLDPPEDVRAYFEGLTLQEKDDQMAALGLQVIVEKLGQGVRRKTKDGPLRGLTVVDLNAAAEDDGDEDA